MKEMQTEKSGKEPGRLRKALSRLDMQDTDTMLYVLMCIFTIPIILLGAVFLWMARRLPTEFEGCVFRAALGLYCPGCGGTRAVWALLRGDIPMALYYHFPAVYGVALYVVYFVSQTLMRVSRGRIRGMQFRPVYLYVMLGMIVVNFIAKNVMLGVFHIAMP